MADVFQIVTDRMLNLLQLGEIPWHRPWCSVRGGAFNRISGKQYSLLNQMMLTHTGEYATFGQWTKLGGKIRKGEKSEIVVFWKWPEEEETNKDPAKDGQDQKRKGPVLRFYRDANYSGSPEGLPFYLSYLPVFLSLFPQTVHHNKAIRGFVLKSTRHSL